MCGFDTFLWACPADAWLLRTSGLVVNQASLTGESVPIDKISAAVFADTTPLADRKNMVYLGTVVVSGKGLAIAVATGMKTQLGHIAGILQRQELEATPHQRRLAELGRVPIVICLAIVSLIFALLLLRGGKPTDGFLLAVSLAVAGVPEGLPAVVTIARQTHERRDLSRGRKVAGSLRGVLPHFGR